MTGETTTTPPEAHTWEDTMPHFSVSEKGNRITAPPLNAPGMLGFVAVVTFVLWIPSGAGAALFFWGVSEHNPPAVWQWIVTVLYTFLPALLIDLTSDEARDRIGQRATANRVAAIPAFAGGAVGLLIAALWVGGFSGGIIALASVVSSMGAAIATVTAWAGLRYARRRQTWMASMHHNGMRIPGVLREVTFLQKWSGGNPQFRVTVEFVGQPGPVSVTANMVTTKRRVPLRGTAVVVTRALDDRHSEVLIELADNPEFDRAHAKYEQPSGT